MILGLISDAHGHREAFVQAVSVLQAAGAERIYFLGDAVGYLPGDSVVEAIRQLDVIPIRGNHEAMLLSDAVDTDRESVYRLRETARMMSAANRAFIETWPERLEIDSPSGGLLLVHGSPVQVLDGYVYPDTDLTGLSESGRCAVFMGQTHRPFVRSSGETLFVNVGSCGLPRDCGHLGAACLYDDARRTASIIRFDIRAATEAALRRCGPVAPEVLAVFERRADGCPGA